MEVDITYGNITVRLGGVATYCGTMVQPDSPSGVQIISYSYGMAGTGYQVINPVPVGDATAITSTVATGTWLQALDSLVVLFVRSPRPAGVTSNNDEALAIVVVPYAVSPSEASTRIRPSAIGNPSNSTIAAHRATSFTFDTTQANSIPSVIDVDALPTTWGTWANNRPVIDDYMARFAGFCGELWTGWGTASQTPSQQHPMYGRTMASLVSESLLMMVSQDDAAKRKTLAFRMTQWGVDLYGAYVSGRNDQVDGGHYQGRKALVVLAGHMLGVSAMLDATATFPGQFNEDEQFYVGSPAWVWGWTYGYKGRTEFPTNISAPIASWTSNPTIFYLTGYFEHVCGTQLGTALAMRLLGRTAQMGVAHDGMMAQWMEGPSSSDLAAMTARDASLASINWSTSYSAYDATDFARASWEKYSDAAAGLDASGQANVPVSASGASALSISGTGSSSVALGASGTSSLAIAASGSSAVGVGASGAAALQVGSNGAASVGVSASGVSTIGAVGIIATGVAGVPVSASGTSTIGAIPVIVPPPPQQAPKGIGRPAGQLRRSIWRWLSPWA